ncbi:hypothetical protein AXFE_02280 [Acidithrix ferrooxidans]|uniref:Transposase DDE domain-containing protein n=1 Tax=Acidithrix ferrooxidans TaxID=1280514 RepID=A0A0D8HLL5_9ACTN|nr:hypothetical protein AXFE_02280 [Acidithrix ferrooxidans]
MLLKRAWLAGAGRGDEPLTIDVDSTVCQVYGNKKEGAYFGYTNLRGYHPLVSPLISSLSSSSPDTLPSMRISRQLSLPT